MKNIYAFYILNISKLLKAYQSGFLLAFVVLCIWLAHYAFWGILLLFDNGDSVAYMEFITNAGNSSIIQFAPEAWLSLLGLVLGTLIIVISVASQSTPKLIDLYTGDRTSLLYIWYIVGGSVHNMFLQLYGNSNLELADAADVTRSILLNTYIMLPAALMLAVPYVLYILRYTKTSNVIEKIYKINEKRIERMAHRSKVQLLNDEGIIGEYQFELFESLNQMDDLLEYVNFKEPKGDIIHNISQSIQNYIRIKGVLIENSPNFFKISKGIKPDVSFKTMTAQFPDMEKSRTFYEQKGFRLLGNAYIKIIENDDFDLASLCAYELSECGRAAIEQEDFALINVVLIRFNTLLRFGIKHGLKNQEARNLYNGIFHYSGFIHHLIRYKNYELIKKSCTYLNIYVNEIYRHSRKEGSFIFLVDVFTWEFKRILIALSRVRLDISLQQEILELFLKIDNLADKYDEKSQRGLIFSTGVRSLQIALALYYLRESIPVLAGRIVEDILNDHQFMDQRVLREEVRKTCANLNRAEATFWEDTDRGNSNLYFSHDTAYIEDFLSLFDQMSKDRQSTIRN